MVRKRGEKSRYYPHPPAHNQTANQKDENRGQRVQDILDELHSEEIPAQKSIDATQEY
jgi:hypothetical protein